MASGPRDRMTFSIAGIISLTAAAKAGSIPGPPGPAGGGGGGPIGLGGGAPPGGIITIATLLTGLVQYPVFFFLVTGLPVALAYFLAAACPFLL